MISPLAGFRRIVIKIGSSLLVEQETGELRADWLRALAADIAGLRKDGREIVIVTSGAVALGRSILGLSSPVLALEQSQAAASVGQIALSQGWRDALAGYGITAGQILITPNITEERRYFLNARTTMHTLLRLGAVPIINENDSVATAEIRYGDNDRLSARVASMIEADALVVLSDVDGLYSASPLIDAAARHIPLVETITPEIAAMAGGAASYTSRGGMATKIEAARIATRSGTTTLIARGTDLHPIRALMEGARHTMFAPANATTAARKRWILGALDVSGQIHVDDGAVGALRTGKSLLPIGVTRVTGDFARGDAVAILAPGGKEIARGLSGLDAEEARLAKGKRSEALTQILGFGSRTEMVHRDNLVLIGPGEGGDK
jgi:glutamate 5-kinase